MIVVVRCCMDGAIVDGGKQASTGIATKSYTNAVIVAV
jgi:hypothetical protein